LVDGLRDRPVVQAWRELAGGPSDGRLRVVVNPESWLAPPGWIGIVAIGDVITASVPRTDLEQPVAAALAGLGGEEATSVDVLHVMPFATATLGPSALLYPPTKFEPSPVAGEEASEEELAALLAAGDPEDLDESGLSQIETAAFVSRACDGAIASACGYRRWPNGVAHLSVLTLPEHRRQGHGCRAAAAAIRHAATEGLLPQWRARPIASQRLAIAVGLNRMGTQLSVQPT
jgi:hypothetical protein